MFLHLVNSLGRVAGPPAMTTKAFTDVYALLGRSQGMRVSLILIVMIIVIICG